jgi:hypothetical protein
VQLPLHPRVEPVSPLFVLLLHLPCHVGIPIPPPVVLLVFVILFLVEDHSHAQLVVQLLVAPAVVDLEVGDALAWRGGRRVLVT